MWKSAFSRRSNNGGFISQARGQVSQTWFHCHAHQKDIKESVHFLEKVSKATPHTTGIEFLDER
jgi:hypothetical protein